MKKSASKSATTERPLGIETIKEVLGNLFNLGFTIYDVAEDGQFSLITEGPALGLSVIKNVPPIISKADIALAQIKDMDQKERLEIAEWAKDRFDIENDVLEATIEGFIDLLVRALALIEDTILLVKSLKRPEPLPAVSLTRDGKPVKEAHV